MLTVFRGVVSNDRLVAPAAFWCEGCGGLGGPLDSAEERSDDDDACALAASGEVVVAVGFSCDLDSGLYVLESGGEPAFGIGCFTMMASAPEVRK